MGRTRGPEKCPTHKTARRWNGRQWKCNACDSDAAALREAREPGYHSRMWRAWGQRLKTEVILAYGGVCACCGETEPLFLQLDHIDGPLPGEPATYKNGKGQGTRLYSWLKKNEYPTGIRVLCANCNFGRELNGGVCPHGTRT